MAKEPLGTGTRIALDVNFPLLIESSGEINPEICVLGQEPGIYHGLLLYRLEGAPTGIGVWINVSLSKEEGKRVLGLTGFGIEGSEKGNLEFWLVGIVIVLFGALIILLRKFRAKKPRIIE